MADLSCSQTLIDALLDPRRYPHSTKNIRLLETHISWVLLAGRYAYKIKKPVNLGFLDFTELNRRHFYCREEIRLNRRLASKLYIDVLPIGGCPEDPHLGTEPAFEYAVKMRRFSNANLLDHLATLGKLNTWHIDRLAQILARFHGDQPAANADSSFGTPEAIFAPARHNFEQIAALLGEEPSLTALKEITEQEYTRCLPLFAQRRRDGFVRECHGDLHLGNIVLLEDEPTPFDGIEFDPNLRWIDVFNDIAFLIMDLQYRGRSDLAFRFLNAYLELCGDYQGMDVLRFYLGYRAMVRAKIAAIRASQTASEALLEEYRNYTKLAARSLTKGQGILIITHGLPACGKTTVSQAVVEKLQAIRLRTDVERKRMFGFTAHECTGGTIYTLDATQRTYSRLLQLARELLACGFPVIVDAAFLKHVERLQFQALANEMGTPFVILSIQTTPSLLRLRIKRRQEEANDASEADLTVLEKLESCAEPLQADELTKTVMFVNNGEVAGITEQIAAWDHLAVLTGSAETTPYN